MDLEIIINSLDYPYKSSILKFKYAFIDNFLWRHLRYIAPPHPQQKKKKQNNGNEPPPNLNYLELHSISIISIF